jgi:hypothetical protein
MLDRLPFKAAKANMSLISKTTSVANRMDQDMAESGRGNDESTALQTLMSTYLNKDAASDANCTFISVIRYSSWKTSRSAAN